MANNDICKTEYVDANGNIYYVGYSYRLRAGSPIYDESGNAFLHTFGSEINKIIIYDCVKGAFLPSSDDFMGQGGNYMSASFSKIGDRDDHFQGRIVYAPEFGSESIVTSYFSGSESCDYGDEITFIECTSLNISYDIMGLVSVSYTVVSNKPGVKVFYTVSTGGRNSVSFSGFPVNITTNAIPNTTWYETHVTLMAVTAGSSSFSSAAQVGGDTAAGLVNYPEWWYKYRKA